MRTIALLFAITCCGFASNAQSSASKQKLEKLCGCFNVEFKYAETFALDPAYKPHDKGEISYGTELVFPLEMTDKKVVLQHLLVISDQMIVKHWREDWTYEDSILWTYQGNNVWTKEQLKLEQYKGKWFQKVWEVSDAPRYQGMSEWVTTDNKTFWENTADAPLPRREYTVRNDYNILRRTNRIIITEKGWIHDQYNQKIVRAGGTDKLLVEEKGLNTYEKKDDKQCEAARLYWEKNKEYWAKVRTAWDKYLNNHAVVNLKFEVGGKPLHEYLFDLAKDYSQGKIKNTDIELGIQKHLDQFLGSTEGVAQTNK